MSKTGNYIEGKVEEFRISGGKPVWIGLTLEVLTKLSDEFRPKVRNGVVYQLEYLETDIDPNSKIAKFLGMDVVLIEDDGAPKDGVYLHDERF